MGYILLFIESLATSWLFVALLVACIGRLRSAPLRLALTVLVVLLPIVCYSVINGAAGFLEFGKHMHTGFFWPLTALTLVFLFGAIEIVRRGRTRQVAASDVAAATWPRGKLAAALVVAASLHVMTFANLDSAAKQSLTTVRAEANALAMLVAPQRLPDADNAALIYYQAFDAIGSESTGPYHEWPQIWRDASDALDWKKVSEFDFKSAELSQFLNERAGLLGLLHMAAARPGCYFDRDFGRPTADMRLPEIQDLRIAARLFAVHARASAEHGNLKNALLDVNSIYAIARHIGMEPILVSMLVAATIDQLASETLRAVIRGRMPAQEELAVIYVDGTVSYRKILARALRMEEAFILNTFASLDGMDFGALAGLLQISNERTPLDGIGPFYRVFLLSGDLEGYHSFMHEGEQAVASSNYGRTKLRLSELDNGLRENPPGIITALATPSLVNSNEAAVIADAMRGVARVGLAMHRYRTQKGQFPDRLDQLSAEFIDLLPRDPYDGKPLRLKKSADGWIVYSIGPNLKDDGGKRPFEGANPSLQIHEKRYEDGVKQGDLTFEFVAPKPEAK